MKAADEFVAQANTWQHKATRNKVGGWLFTIISLIVLVAGWESDNVSLMIIAVWLHLCGEATFLLAFGFERSGRLAELLAAQNEG